MNGVPRSGSRGFSRAPEKTPGVDSWQVGSIAYCFLFNCFTAFGSVYFPFLYFPHFSIFTQSNETENKWLTFTTKRKKRQTSESPLPPFLISFPIILFLYSLIYPTFPSANNFFYSTYRFVHFSSLWKGEKILALE